MSEALLKKVGEFQKPSTDEAVQNMVNLLGDTVSIKALEDVVKHYKREVRRLLTEDLLEWMQEKDITSFETEDYKVDIKTFVSAKVENAEGAFDWLAQEGYEAVIKTVVDFPKGEFTSEAQKLLTEIGASFTKEEKVHPATLKKIMSDRLNDGDTLPDEDQGIKVSYFDECKVKIK